MAHSPHRRWKGCPMCDIHLDEGQAVRTPWKTIRKLGKKRRISRHYIPKDQEDDMHS